jgi:hypothetical protein
MFQGNFSSIQYQYPFHYGGSDVIAISEARGHLGVSKTADSSSLTTLLTVSHCNFWSPYYRFHVLYDPCHSVNSILGSKVEGFQASTSSIFLLSFSDPRKALLHIKTRVLFYQPRRSISSLGLCVNLRKSKRKTSRGGREVATK